MRKVISPQGFKKIINDFLTLRTCSFAFIATLRDTFTFCVTSVINCPVSAGAGLLKDRNPEIPFFNGNSVKRGLFVHPVALAGIADMLVNGLNRNEQ